MSPAKRVPKTAAADTTATADDAAAPAKRAPKRRFTVATAAPTAPTAEYAIPTAAAPRRPDAPATRSGRKDRTAFTWRLTPDQGIVMDDMLLRLKRQLGTAKLDRAAMLAALVEVADSNPAVFGALIARLQDTLIE